MSTQARLQGDARAAPAAGAAPASRAPATGMRARLARIPKPLAILLVLAALQGLCWAVVTAPLQGPDESGHVSYVQNLGERGRPPIFTDSDGAESTQVATALRFLGLRPLVGLPYLRPAWSPADVAGWRAIERDRSHGGAWRRNAGGPNAVAKNPPLYYLYEAVPYLATRGLGLFDWLFALRLANVLLFVATVGFTWLAAGELFRDLWRRTATTALVALEPQLAFMGGVVNPDSLLTLEWTAFTFVALRALVRGPTFANCFALLVTVTASVLTQGRGLPLIPIALVALALALARHRPVRPRALAGIGAGGVFAAAAIGLYRATLSPASGAYGAEIAFRSPRPFRVGEFLAQIWQFYLPKLGFMPPRLGPPYGAREVWVESFVGKFGALDVRFPSWVYSAVEGVLIALLVGVVAALIAHRRAVRWDVAALLGATVVILTGFLHLASYRNLLGTQDPLMVGRYLLPLLAPLAIAVVWSLHRLPARAALVVMTTLLALEALLGVSGLGITLERFYG